MISRFLAGAPEPALLVRQILLARQMAKQIIGTSLAGAPKPVLLSRRMRDKSTGNASDCEILDRHNSFVAS